MEAYIAYRGMEKEDCKSFRQNAFCSNTAVTLFVQNLDNTIKSSEFRECFIDVLSKYSI